MKSIYFRTPQEWRTWLQSNHDKETEVWLIFFKKDIRPSLDYESAVEEALCFGWIDSIIKKIDESRFARKFTPLESPVLYGGDEIYQSLIPIRKGGVKAPSFLTGFTYYLPIHR